MSKVVHSSIEVDISSDSIRMTSSGNVSARDLAIAHKWARLSQSNSRKG